MLYFFLDQKLIKLLSLKKSVMGQYEAFLFDKQYQTDLLKSGKVINVDIIASAVKEAINNSPANLKEKNAYLILPQESFSFLRTTIPTDIAKSAVSSFIKDKAQAQWQINLDDYYLDYLIEESNNQSIINLFAIEKSIFAKYQEAFALINQRIVSILPETLAYFKLFEKTLRKEKLEKILYTRFENDQLSGYLFDGGGLISADRWQTEIPKQTTIEEILKKQIVDFEKNGQKLSRLIISGQDSEKIRQDTFTKSVGLWTNPLKRIISDFYQDYLKQLITPNNQPFSILKFDVCFGAFIFSVENKQFSIYKKTTKIALPKLKLPIKEIAIFLASFIFSFIVFIFLSKYKADFSFINKLIKTNPLTKSVTPTPTQSPSPTPTPEFTKKDLKIKVLNGSGIAGKASQLKEIFSDLDYGEIITDNADNFDYETSVLQVKNNRLEASIWIKKDLKDYLPNIQVESLEEDQTADIVLIIGKDFE